MVAIAVLTSSPLSAQSNTLQSPKLAPSALTVLPDIHQLVPAISRPDYERDILMPLRTAQAKARAVADAQAAAILVAQQVAAAQIVVSAPIVAPVASPTVLDHTALMAAAGIDAADYEYVDFIVSHESGWRVDAANPSGAYGLPQSLPASKMASAGSDWATNPVTQLRWMNGYVGRYGGWRGAYGFWVDHNWY